MCKFAGLQVWSTNKSGRMVRLPPGSMTDSPVSQAAASVTVRPILPLFFLIGASVNSLILRAL